MKLSPIEVEHLLLAADELDKANENSWSEYWIQIPGRQRDYPFKVLTRNAYRIATGTDVSTDFFQSNESYRNFITRKFGYPVIFKVRDNIPFFTAGELEYFADHAGQTYSNANPQNVITGQYLKRNIIGKTNTWAKALNIPGFTVHLNNSWQQRGLFVKYTWATIYKNEDAGKKIFFTVGIDSEEPALIYKLDCQKSNPNMEKALTPGQYEIFKRIVSATDAGWQPIYKDELHAYDWEKLISETSEFINYYTHLYDEIIQTVWDKEPPAIQSHGLRIHPVPKGIYDKAPEYNGGKKGPNPNYDDDNKCKKEIGDGGEKMVLAMEQQGLIAAGQPDLAALVCKVEDWQGFDIRSYFPDGREKLVEVKTTPASKYRPFVMTRNEKRIMLKYADDYCLYRLYNYNAEDATADCFILQGDFSSLVLEETLQYNVYLRT